MGTITILFVDQVGSTLQLSTLGDSSAVEIVDRLKAVVDEHLARHNGVFHKHTGDGFMATFTSCVDAVDCAISLHATTASFNEDLPFERRIVLRMGLHTGEPLVHETGPIGAAVVVAARLCDLAGAGQILVSDVVRLMLEPRQAYRLTPVGLRHLKGFPEPMRCFVVRPREPGSDTALPTELEAQRDTPFIGRAAELDRLRVAFVEAAEGTPTGLVVAGEPGAGKTRLVGEFAAEAHQQGARLLYASGEAAIGSLAAELGSSPAVDAPVIAVADDVADLHQVREVVDLLTAPSASRMLAIVVLARTDLDEQTLGLPVMYVRGLPSQDVQYLLELGGTKGDVAARARELVATAHGSPAAVRAAVTELHDAALRDDLRGAIDQAITLQEEEERSFAAITANLLALRTESPAQEPGSGEVPPYKGLVAYRAQDSGWFCGRDELTAQLVAHASISRFLAVTGSSGSGKSSLVRAGLIAALKSGAVSGSASWPILVLTPHSRPLVELAEQLVAHADGDSASVLADRLRARPTALADLGGRLMEDRPPGSRLLVVVDQFEEVFTQCQSDEEREAFFDALVHAAEVPEGPTTVVIVLRGDYYGHCALHPELAELVAGSHVLVGPMSPSEVRLAIEEPARRAGLVVDAELTDRAVDDASGEPGMLPLLSTAMLETWKRRRGDRLTVDAYLASGGVRGAIARLGESVYEDLSPEQRTALRPMLLRLAELGEDGDDVRRRAAIDELVTNPTQHEVLDGLVSHRLVTVDAGRAEVAHEALLREWPRLRTWLEEDRVGRRLHRRLTLDAAAWDESGRADDLLYRGARLDGALEWAVGHADEVHPAEQAFLDAGRATRQQEQSASRRAARRVRWLAIALGLVLIAAVVAVVLYQVQRNAEAEARGLAEQSAALALTLQSVQTENPALALALASESASRTGTPIVAARKGLLDAGVAFGHRGLQQIGDPMIGDGGPLFGVAYTRDGALLASSGKDIRLWDAKTGAPVGHPLVGHECNADNECNVSSVAFNQNGTLLASAGDDGTVRLWDVGTQTEQGGPLQIGSGKALSVAFSPDGTWLAATGDDGSVGLWDVTTGQQLRTFHGHDPTKAVWAVAFSADGSRMATGSADMSVRIWDPRTGEQVGQPLLGHTDEVQGVAFSPDGHLLASSGSLKDHTVRLWDVATGAPIGSPLNGHTLGVWGVAFNRTGTLLASGSEDGTIRLWDVATGSEVAPPATGHLKTVFGIAFSPDGRELASAGADATVRRWSVHDPRTQVLGPHPGKLFGVGFSPDGSLVAAAGEQGTVQLWDVATGTAHGEALAGHDPEKNVSAAVFSPDGKIVASASDDTTVGLWDLGTGKPAAPNLDVGEGVYGLAISRDGARLAGVGANGTVVVWDTATWTHAVEGFSGHTDAVWSAAFSPDGQLLATGSGDGTVRLWDPSSGQSIAVLDVGSGVNVVRFSADGKTLATGSDDGVVRLWDVESRKVRRELSGHTEGVYALAFDPRSDVIVSSGSDQTIRVWDTRTGTPIATTVAGHQGPVWGIALDPTGRFLASAGADGSVFLWDWVVDATTACELAKPYVTAKQVAPYLPPGSGEPACALL